MSGPDVDFWRERFERAETPWDRGGPSPQLARWLPSIAPGSSVLVPGCGSGWEVAELAAHGARTTGLDYAAIAVAKATAFVSSRGLEAEVVEANVLDWSPPAPVDAIYEQTCLCALHPDHWVRYAAQLERWLAPGGRIFAMLMQRVAPDAARGRVQGPPYHCDINAVRALLPADRWEWPEPPYDVVAHPSGWSELAAVIVKRPTA